MAGEVSSGKTGGGVSPVLISCCQFTLLANPETRPEAHVLQWAAERPPVSLKLGRTIKRSFASEVALLDVDMLRNKHWFIYE